MCICYYVAGARGEVTRWPIVKGSPDGVSVSPDGSVVVAIRDAGHVVIFSPTGQLVSEIKLPSELANPRHAVQLGNGQLLLCHGWGSSAYGICVVGNDGHVIKSSSSSSSSRPAGSAAGSLPAPKFFTPTHLALDRHGNILAAEFSGNAVRLYKANLEYVGNVVGQSAMLHQPFRLCFDHASRQLYVGEYTGGGRVLVFGK